MESYIVSLYLFSFLFYLLSFFLKPKFLLKFALWSLFLGFLGNLYLIIKHASQARRLPLTNTSETILSLITLIVFIFLILKYKKQLPATAGLFVSLFSFIALFFIFRFKKPLTPLLPALQSKWLVFHVTSCIVAYSFFAIAFLTTIIYLFNRHTKTIVVGTIHRCICMGFFFLTSGIILGSIWGKSAWGHWWNWDPKETWALITWLIYASYIQDKLLGESSERRLAWIAIIGFLSCLFTYLGVNYILKGLHSYV